MATHINRTSRSEQTLIWPHFTSSLSRSEPPQPATLAAAKPPPRARRSSCAKHGQLLWHGRRLCTRVQSSCAAAHPPWATALGTRAAPRRRRGGAAQAGWPSGSTARGPGGAQAGRPSGSTAQAGGEAVLRRGQAVRRRAGRAAVLRRRAGRAAEQCRWLCAMHPALAWPPAGVRAQQCGPPGRERRTLLMRAELRVLMRQSCHALPSFLASPRAIPPAPRAHVAHGSIGKALPWCSFMAASVLMATQVSSPSILGLGFITGFGDFLNRSENLHSLLLKCSLMHLVS
jgi:hypothetical protein